MRRILDFLPSFFYTKLAFAFISIATTCMRPCVRIDSLETFQIGSRRVHFTFTKGLWPFQLLGFRTSFWASDLTTYNPFSDNLVYVRRVRDCY
jgi:hypothetical protein